MFKKILPLLIFSLSLTQESRSSTGSESDIYGDSIPKSFTAKGIRYTTPALQGMAINHISPEDIANIMKTEHADGKKYIHHGNIYLLLRKSADEIIEVASVWKE